ncbi:MAG: hypothetical protein NVS2B9_01580 [Myxococcales bacterium]
MQTAIVFAGAIAALGGALGCGGASSPKGGAATQRTLTVSVSGNGRGMVRGAGLGDCRNRCANSVAEGSRVSLSALPDAGSVFVGWTQGCTGTGSCEVLLAGDEQVSASFTRQSQIGKHVLAVVKTGSGTVQSLPGAISCGSACTAAFDQDAKVSLAASPDAGWTFAGWGGACSGAGGCSVSLAADATVYATFRAVVPKTSRLTVVLAGDGSGQVASAPAGIDCGTSCSAPFPSGTSVALLAVAASGSSFTGWSGACAGAGNCSVSLATDVVVTATFYRTLPPLPAAASCVHRPAPRVVACRPPLSPADPVLPIPSGITGPCMQESFDGIGKPLGRSTAVYDAGGRMTHSTQEDPSGKVQLTLDYQFDGCGNEAFRQRADASGAVVEAAEHSFREDGLLERSASWPVQDGTCEAVTYEYRKDDRGRIVSRLYSRPGSSEDFVYDSKDRVVERDYTFDSIVSFATFDYHPGGALRSTTWHPGMGAGSFSRRDFDSLGYPVSSEYYREYVTHTLDAWTYDASHRVTEHDQRSSLRSDCSDSATVTRFWYDDSGTLEREVATTNAYCQSRKAVLTTTYSRPAPATVVGETRDEAGVLVQRTRNVTGSLGMVIESDRDIDGKGFKPVFRRDYSCWASQRAGR